MKKIIKNEFEVEIKEEGCVFTFHLKNPPIERYFGESAISLEMKNWQNEGIKEFVEEELSDNLDKFSGLNIESVEVDGFDLTIKTDKYNQDFIDFVCDTVRLFYEFKEMHITRMFGSYILIQRQEEGLKAVMATPIPIKYCPLMIKLLKEVGGENANSIIASLQTENEREQQKMMCKLINDVVIKGEYFDTNRPLNSCEANVLFGASETMSSALEEGLIDCSVIVSNNLGTIITTNASNTQGAVKRMTGLFYSTPSKKLVETAVDAKIIPVFPYTANIDQLAGVKMAIELGYKNIAVSVASHDNFLHKNLAKLEEENGVRIYKFGLCSTGITEDTAKIMNEHSDVVWSCASKYVKEYIEPKAIAQVGIKIPVYILTENGYEIIFNHLKHLDKDVQNVKLSNFEKGDRPVFLHSNGKIKQIHKKDLHECLDCPHPCI